jgi:hypothetical protein
MAGFATPQDRSNALAFFEGHDAAHALFHALLGKAQAWGPFQLTATKSRVSITPRTRAIWCHEANDDGSIWLGFLLPRKVESPRLRSGLAGGRWSHHVKVRDAADLDAELLGWLREAYDADVAGTGELPPERSRKGKGTA